MAHGPHALPSNSEITAWADQSYSNNIRPHLMPTLDRNSVEVPSGAAMSNVVHEFTSTRECFETLLEFQKTVKEEKKDK